MKHDKIVMQKQKSPLDKHQMQPNKNEEGWKGDMEKIHQKTDGRWVRLNNFVRIRGERSSSCVTGHEEEFVFLRYLDLMQEVNFHVQDASAKT